MQEQSLSSSSNPILTLLSDVQRDAMLADLVIEGNRRIAALRAPTELPDDWHERVKSLFGAYFGEDFSPPHEQLWQWVDDIEQDSKPRSFIAIWPRGRGKSTTTEAAVADVAVRKVRTYCLYCCSTQDQADKHVATIARMLESSAVAQYAPSVGKPRISNNGNRLWNRKTVSTATGFTVEAIGLDKAVRGQKIDWARPDLIVFDDIDEVEDSELTTTKKENAMTSSIIPAGSTHCAVLFVQNLIHPNSIASRLAKTPDKEGAAQYLMTRIVSGPYKAVDDLRYEREQVAGLWRWRITAGVSLWHGFDISICEDEINRVGPKAYIRESQNEVDGDAENALMSAEDFDRTRRTLEQVPDLVRVAVAVDPPGGATECGIVCGGKALIGKDWHGFTLEDATMPKGVTPEKGALAVLHCAHRNHADVIFIERNYGGDMVSSTLRQTKWLDDDGKLLMDGSKVKIEEVIATRGKAVRAEPVATVFQQGRGHHVGTFDLLEKEWRQFVPGVSDSPNRLDAEVWLYTGLELVGAQSTVQVMPKATNLFGARDQQREQRGNDRRGIYGSRS
jgi:hypothetical protein